MRIKEQVVKEDEWKTEQKGRQVPCEHFNILEIYGKKNPYLCTDGASQKKTKNMHTNKQKKKFKK